MPSIPTTAVPGLPGSRGIFFDYGNYVLLTNEQGYWMVDKNTLADDIIAASSGRDTRVGETAMPSIPTTPIPGLRGARGIFFDNRNYVLITNNKGYWMVDKNTLADEVIDASLGDRVRETAIKKEKVSPPPTPEPVKAPQPATSQPPKGVHDVSRARDQQTQTYSTGASVNEKLKRLEENTELTRNWDITRDDNGTWYFPKNFLAKRSDAKEKASVSASQTIFSRSGKSDSTSDQQTQTYSTGASVNPKFKRLEENTELTKNWDITRDDYGTWYFPKHFLAKRSGAKYTGSGRQTIPYRTGISDSTVDREIHPELTKNWDITKVLFG